MKAYVKIIFILILSIALAGLSGCTEKDKASSEEGKKAVQAKENSDKDNNNAAADPANEEKAVQEFVLENTKIVKIYNISKRVNEKYPGLGPFFVIRGIDERGQKCELWVKDMKIYDMVNS